MKPRTKLQLRVFNLSRKLPLITKKQTQWAYDHCLQHLGYRTKTKISCLDCGHVWPAVQNIKSCICPGCTVKLRIVDTLKRNFDQGKNIMAIVDVIEDLQLIRYFEINSYHKAGNKPRRYVCEIVQQWFTPGGKLTIVGGVAICGSSSFSGQMEIRANFSNYWSSNKYDIFADKIYPESNCLPVYKRNGFSSKIQGVRVYSFLDRLLKDSMTETLLKAKQYSLVSARSNNKSESVYKFWDTLKICIRNKYIVKDANSYLDYLDLLQINGRDLRSTKYVCPLNFTREHDRLVEKRARNERDIQAVRDKEQAEKRKLIAEKEQIAYVAQKSAFFGLVFTDGNLVVKFIESVQEFIEEGNHHKHCVYTNSYYSKDNSLCFSASFNGNPTETVEVSLPGFRIIQSRGLKNTPSAFHDEIISLVKKNLNAIKKRYKGSKTSITKLNSEEMEAA